jgi:adenylate kinase family enzyme
MLALLARICCRLFHARVRRSIGMARPNLANTLTPPAPPLTLAALGRRIVVLGVTGSGKSTLATELARRLGAPRIELDAFQWEPNWTPAQPEVFRQRVGQAVAGDAWVVDGNYRQSRDLIWPRAQTIIWLDYSLPVIYGRLLRRTLWRTLARVELWSGNRERLWPQFFTRDSLFVWAITSQPEQRREYPLIPTLPESSHVTFIHLRSPRTTTRWLATLR